jgi:hypothetical protein
MHSVGSHQCIIATSLPHAGKTSRDAMGVCVGGGGGGGGFGVWRGVVVQEPRCDPSSKMPTKQFTFG